MHIISSITAVYVNLIYIRIFFIFFLEVSYLVYSILRNLHYASLEFHSCEIATSEEYSELNLENFCKRTKRRTLVCSVYENHYCGDPY